MKWGIMWKPMSFRLDRCFLLLLVLCKLHNFIIDHGPSRAQPSRSSTSTAPSFADDVTWITDFYDIETMEFKGTVSRATPECNEHGCSTELLQDHKGRTPKPSVEGKARRDKHAHYLHDTLKMRR
jgi:hypothetical protein